MGPCFRHSTHCLHDIPLDEGKSARRSPGKFEELSVLYPPSQSPTPRSTVRQKYHTGRRRKRKRNSGRQSLISKIPSQSWPRSNHFTPSVLSFADCGIATCHLRIAPADPRPCLYSNGIPFGQPCSSSPVDRSQSHIVSNIVEPCSPNHPRLARHSFVPGQSSTSSLSRLPDTSEFPEYPASPYLQSPMAPGSCCHHLSS